MGFSVIFGTTTKRINSTYQAMSNSITKTVVLKENTSIINPVFIVKAEENDDFSKYNYCRCVTFHRYYWIDDVIYTSGNGGGSAGIYEIHCHCDVLASMYDYVKDEIHYVKYTGDIKKADLEIDDERLAPEIPLMDAPHVLIPEVPLGDLTFIIKVKILTNGAGASILYALNATNFKKLMNDWITKSGLDQVNTWDDFVKAATNHLGGISNNVSDFLEDWWILYIDSSVFGTMNDPVYMGTWTTDAVGKNLGFGVDARCKKYNDIHMITLPSPIPNTPAHNQLHFLKSKKYTTMALKTPSGTVDISTDTTVLYTNNVTLRYKAVFDCITGDAVFEVWDDATASFLGSGTVNLKFTPMGSISEGGTDSANLKALGNIGSLALKAGAMSSAISTASFQSNIGRSQVLSSSSKQNLISAAQTRQNAINDLTSFGSGIIGSMGSTPMSGSTGGGSFNDSFVGFIIQTMNYANKNNTFNHIITVITTCVIPAVCTDTDSYNAYAVEHGYPCSKMLKLSTLANNTFLQCSMASVESSGPLAVGFTPQEISEFNNWLNHGIFIDASTGKKNDDYQDPEEARKKLPGVVYIPPKEEEPLREKANVAEKASL